MPKKIEKVVVGFHPLGVHFIEEYYNKNLQIWDEPFLKDKYIYWIEQEQHFLTIFVIFGRIILGCVTLDASWYIPSVVKSELKEDRCAELRWMTFNSNYNQDTNNTKMSLFLKAFEICQQWGIQWLLFTQLPKEWQNARNLRTYFLRNFISFREQKLKNLRKILIKVEIPNIEYKENDDAEY